MRRTQIQLPDDLYRRVKQFAAEREVSLAEIIRRGIEMLLDRYPSAGEPNTDWSLPRVDGGGLKVELGDLRNIATGEEEARGRIGAES